MIDLKFKVGGAGVLVADPVEKKLLCGEYRRLAGPGQNLRQLAMGGIPQVLASCNEGGSGIFGGIAERLIK